MTYADTGFLVSLYLSESTSAEASTVVEALPEPITVTWLTELEFENAVHRAVLRSILTPRIAVLVLEQYAENKAQGAYLRAIVDAEAMAAEASRLAKALTPTVGTRTLDLLHVASAHLLKCDRFLSFDERQRRAASYCGLEVHPDRKLNPTSS